MANTFARYIVEQATRFGGWAKRNQRVKLPINGQIKVNLGCGLHVAPGWVNIDGSLNAIIANSPQWLRSFAYTVSGARAFYSKDYYCDTLRTNRFVHHDLTYGIPLEDSAVDFVYSSHFLEHLKRPIGKRLLEECFRVGEPRAAVSDRFQHAGIARAQSDVTARAARARPDTRRA